MLDSRVAKRYAVALFSLAVERNLMEQVEADLQTVSKTLNEFPDMRRILQSPVVDKEAKKAQVRQVFGASVTPIVLNFLQLLLDRHRENQLEAIRQEYERQADEKRGRVKGHLETAVPVAEAEVAAVEKQLGAAIGKTVQLTASVNPELLAGVRVRMGDRVYDASVRGQLERFRESLRRQQVR